MNDKIFICILFVVCVAGVSDLAWNQVITYFGF